MNERLEDAVHEAGIAEVDESPKSDGGEFRDFASLGIQAKQLRLFDRGRPGN